MSIRKISVSSIGLAATGVLLLSLCSLLSALPASALSVGASVSASSSASGTGVSAAATARLAKIVTQADSDITARINALNDLNTRVDGLKNVSAAEKASVSADVETNITGLTALQAKIDADTDATTAKTDAGTIFTTFRIYALVIPQGWILASSDRVDTITGLMTSLGANIQTRITADQTAGKDVTALSAALTDMQAKITDANGQSASAQAGVSALVPDQGDKTVAASNHAALLASRADIKTATTDLQAARKDITALLQGLKTLDGSASASASTTAQ